MDFIPNKNVHVIDAEPGSGKTTAIISMMNNNPDKKYIYIAPNLSEAERICAACPELHFEEPSDKNKTRSKSKDLLELIERYDNIASTHSLFERLTDETIDKLANRDYIFIMDETMSVLERFNMFPSIKYAKDSYLTSIVKANMETLLGFGVLEVDDLYRVSWVTDRALDGYRNVKEYSDRGLLYYMGGGALLWSYPVRVFDDSVFSAIFVLTYQFAHLTLKSYFDFYKIEYDSYFIGGKVTSFGVPGMELIKNNLHDLKFKQELKKNINIVDYPSMNSIGDRHGKNHFALSNSWYERASSEDFRLLSKKMTNFYMNYSDAKKDERMWTIFQKFQNRISGKYIRKNKDTLVEFNVRATNQYRHKKALIYPINRFHRPSTRNFFAVRGIPIDDSEMALSEMLQWLLRSRLREGKSIDLFVPSWRQRNLLIAYLNNESLDSIY